MTCFDQIPAIAFEGTETANALAYRYYDKDRVVLGKRMEDHLRWAVCYWHSFCWPGSDVFGEGTFNRPWHPGAPVTHELAQTKLDAAFDFFTKLGAPYFCFHDVDVIAYYESVAEYSSNLERMTDAIGNKMGDTGVKLLWGTANLFGHRRYAAGGATNPDPEVFAWAAHQVRSAIEATHALGGANYVLWGGREGYDTLLNTNLSHEMDQLGRFLSLVVEHKHAIGFKGTILIEPKPHEPTKHQYDRDAATVYGFLNRYGLENEVKVNIEANHATLAGHSFEHEVAMAGALGILGSVDINRGDPQNGWDTDQFPNDVPGTTLAMYQLLKHGGFETGGFNFDAKVRRQSIDAEDLFHGHVGGVDVLARALLNAAALIEAGTLDAFVTERYAGWSDESAQAMLSGEMTLAQISDLASERDLRPKPKSGRQEYLENIVNQSC
ncbi:xylose isomerase [Erythrobacter sp. KY5]|uniref:xylose isomerase n=1 Tax=Erythrobacter sp. KY5 TaxID=2011159 RepID=UPI000DBF0048|nr:xylose isomerase [Erythrobacter sp. KY5]AWW74426.1 xylose isomerase [Erythrobacter sp. KY5]